MPSVGDLQRAHLQVLRQELVLAVPARRKRPTASAHELSALNFAEEASPIAASVRCFQELPGMPVTACQRCTVSRVCTHAGQSTLEDSNNSLVHALLEGHHALAPGDRVRELRGRQLPVGLGRHVGRDVHRLAGVRGHVDLDDAVPIVVDLEVYCTRDSHTVGGAWTQCATLIHHRPGGAAPCCCSPSSHWQIQVPGNMQQERDLAIHVDALVSLLGRQCLQKLTVREQVVPRLHAGGLLHLLQLANEAPDWQVIIKHVEVIVLLQRLSGQGPRDEIQHSETASALIRLAPVQSANAGGLGVLKCSPMPQVHTLVRRHLTAALRTLPTLRNFCSSFWFSSLVQSTV